MGGTYSFNASQRTNSNILVPNSVLGKLHNVLLRNGANNPLNLGGVHPPSGGDDLAANVLGDSGGAIEREQERGLELGLGTLDLGLGDYLGEAGPFAERKVDEVVDAGDLVGDEVDSPETRQMGSV